MPCHPVLFWNVSTLVLSDEGLLSLLHSQVGHPSPSHPPSSQEGSLPSPFIGESPFTEPHTQFPGGPAIDVLHTVTRAIARHCRSTHSISFFTHSSLFSSPDHDDHGRSERLHYPSSFVKAFAGVKHIVDIIGLVLLHLRMRDRPSLLSFKSKSN